MTIEENCRVISLDGLNPCPKYFIEEKHFCIPLVSVL